jgi:phosphoglucosamine mutase
MKLEPGGRIVESARESFPPMAKLFGTDGIRGRANADPISAEMALRAGRALAEVLGSKACNGVTIARDPRISGPMLEGALAAGLSSAGVDVTLLGVLPTPGLAVMTVKLGAAAGVMITASHNPFQDNGLKFFGSDGYKFDDGLEARMEELLLDPEWTGTPADQVGRVTHHSTAEELFTEHLASAASGLDLAGIKIVVDCGHGAASAIAPELFRTLGAEVIELANSPDGLNINEQCGAMHPERAAAAVLEHRARIGVSFDGDADRVIFTDETGAIVSGDRILALVAIDLKQRGALSHDTLVATVMSNAGLIDTMRGHGITVETTAVGDRHVIERMREGGFVFGGENSGHLIFSNAATTGDGMLSALMVLGIMKRRATPLSELAAVCTEWPSLLVNLKVPAKPALDKLTKLQAFITEADKSFGTDGRQLVRYSGTETKIRVLVEHRDAATCKQWIETFTQAIREEIG